MFLLDVSESMNSPDKLPLVKSAMKILLEQLDENGSVAIAVYVVVLGLVLHPASVSSRRFECWMLDQLWSRNSACVRNGREESESGRRKPGHVPHRWRLQRWSYGPLGFVDLMQPEAKYGVFLSVLEFGTGNLKDATKEQLADKGSGNNGYIGSLQEACKLLVEDALGMLLRGSEYSRNVTFELAHNGIGQIDDNYCQEFLRLTDTAQLLKVLLVTGR